MKTATGMFKKLSNRLRPATREDSIPAIQSLDAVWEVICLNAVKSLCPNAPPNVALIPPFFRAKEIPASPKRVRRAVNSYAGIMLYNTLKFSGAPRTDTLMNKITELDEALKSIENSNIWVKQLRAGGKSSSSLLHYINSLPQDSQIELNLARPMYEETVDTYMFPINDWFSEHWTTHKAWILSL